LWNFRGVLHVVDFNVDVLSGALAKVDFMFHLLFNVTNIIIDHRQGKYNRQNSNNAESHRGIGHKFVCLDSPV
jgi:hypothetical protein